MNFNSSNVSQALPGRNMNAYQAEDEICDDLKMYFFHFARVQMSEDVCFLLEMFTDVRYLSCGSS